MRHFLYGVAALLLAAIAYQKNSIHDINTNLRKLEALLGLPFAFFPVVADENIVRSFMRSDT